MKAQKKQQRKRSGLNLLLIMSLSVAFIGCEQKGESKGVVGPSGNVTIKSAPYSNGAVALFTNPAVRKIASLFLIPSAHAAAINDFQFCITKMKIKGSVDGAASVSTEAILGLVDISNPDVEQLMGDGSIQIPEGTAISELSLEVHKDAENCSAADFSVSYQGVKLNKDLEFKFKFDPAITINHGDTLLLGLDNVAKAFEAAADAGQLDDQKIGAYLQANMLPGTGEEVQ